MNDLRLDEVHTTLLVQWLVSFAMLQEGLPREVCSNSVFLQVTDTQDRFCHVSTTWKSYRFRWFPILNPMCRFP